MSTMAQRNLHEARRLQAETRKKLPHGSVWRHERSGGEYSIVTTALREADLAMMVVYQTYELQRTPGTTWVRPATEFLDGRFVRINPLESTK